MKISNVLLYSPSKRAEREGGANANIEWKANAPLLNKENIYGTSEPLDTTHSRLKYTLSDSYSRTWGPWNTRALGLDRARASQAALSGSGDM